jgi:soluble lytic murein transglycosylase-like protein
LSVLRYALAVTLIALPADAGSMFGNAGVSDRLNALLDGRLADQYDQPEPEDEAIEGLAVSIDPGPYKDMAREAAEKHGVPVNLFYRLVRQESGWNPNAVSSKGAIGLGQLMPFTAQRLGVDPRDAGENLEGAARYLSQQYRRFGSWRLALAAYNAGPEAVEKYDGIPPYAETQNYVRAILNES